MDIVEFLTARLDEDKQIATAAQDAFCAVDDADSDYEAWAERFDPARVLREVAAKRAIIEDYQLVAANNAIEKATGGDETTAAMRDLIIKSLRMVLVRLATAYSDHPDYGKVEQP